MRLLVIDDSLTIRKLVELSFRGAKDTVLDFANNGQQGIDRARATTPDVILLDYVLPDMKGIDVCRALWSEQRTAATPVILMTAMGAAVTAQFADGAGPVEYLAKPFTTAAVTSRVKAALERRVAIAESAPARRDAPRTGSPKPALSPADRQVLARTVYGALRFRLARIPEWMAEIGSEAPAPFFARRLLSEEALDELVGVLLPAFQNGLSQTALSSAVPAPAASFLSGQLRIQQPLAVLATLAAARASGQLRIATPKETVFIWMREGRVQAASTDDPDGYVGSPPLEGPDEALEAARKEQRSSGKPVFVTLAERGLLPVSTLGDRLRPRTTRILLSLDGVVEGSFEFDESLPVFVFEAQGSQVSMTQIRLESLRQNRPTAPPLDPEAVLERSPGFSKKLLEVELDGFERIALSLLDGKAPISRIAERTGLTRPEVSAIVRRLEAIDLVRKVPYPKPKRQRVLVLDPIDPVFVSDFGACLRERSSRLDLMEIAAGRDPVEAVLEGAPGLVLVDASAFGDRAEETARTMTIRLGPFAPTLLAVLDLSDPVRERRLLEAGFDHVARRPLHISEIEHLMAA